MNIVVVRVDALGDTLLSTPAVVGLREAFPEARLTVVTRRPGTPVMAPLAEVVEVDDDPGPAVRALAPDVVLVFTEKRAGSMAAFRSGAKMRVGFDPGLSQPLKSGSVKLFFTHRLPYPNDPAKDPGLHEVERYWKLAELVGVPPGEPGPLRFDLPEELLRSQQLPGRPLAVQLTPKWGLGDEFLEALLCRLPGAVAFYGPAEREWAAPLVERSGAQGLFREDLREYAAALSSCRLLITVDTGAAHVAAARGVPVVDVFPPENQAHCVRRWRPWKVPHRVVLKGPAALEEVLQASAEL